MPQSLIIRAVEPHEASYITELAMRSKAYWGYSAEFMAACRAELSVSADTLISPQFHVRAAEQAAEIVGFYTLETLSDTEFELEALFVEPEHIGLGIGRALMTHAKRYAAALGGRQLIVQADPNAERFYLAAGGKLIGKQESGSVPGRFLPTFVIPLDD